MASDGIYQRIQRLRNVVLASDHRAKGMLVRALLVALVCSTMLATALFAFRSIAPAADAQALRVSSSATCAQLARVNPTVTNGPSWGRTVLAGHGASGGWFGVDVCSNGFNSVSPNGSNVSCDSLAHGCSPTNDGYGWTFQCPELIVRFSAWAFGDKSADWGRSGWGNAPDLWLPVNHPPDFVMYPNGSSTAPVPGDILIWGFMGSDGQPWPAGPDGSHGGHIAVVAAVHGNKVITAEQNVKWGNQDHPSDTLALTKVGSRWILSGSSQPARTLPTWRWLNTMGHSRGTFGWLHNVKNNGHFPATRANSSATVKKSSNANANSATNAISQQFPGGLPSLSAATVVTRSGTLADLTWSTQSFFSPTSDPGQPEAQTRSLGIPPGNVRLAAGQSAATILLSNGSRYTYALGVNGRLYAARTAPTSFGVFWSDLGQPTGVSLTGSPAASLFAGGVQVAARSSDGSIWWRAGPPDRLGNWFTLGSPAATTFSASVALAGTPGSGAPIVYALGTDGRIYTRIWQDAINAADGTQIPAAWSDWLTLGAQPATTRLTGSLLVVPEIPSVHNWIGPWPDSPINLFAADGVGNLWWFRSTRLSAGWSATRVAGGPAQVRDILGAVAVPPASQNGANAPASSANTANTIALYVAARKASYLCVLPVPGSGASVAEKPAWTTLLDPPAGVASTTAGAAVALGPGNSVLVAAAGDDVVIGGPQALTSALLSSSAMQATDSKKITNPWMRVGTVPAASTFDDAFATTRLDSRWSRSDASARATLDGKGLVLVPGSHGVAALMQSATEGDATLTMQVNRPASLSTKGQVGLVLYQDDANWLTLTVDSTGLVRMCPTMQQKAQSCLTGTANASGVVWLRMQRSGSTFTGMFSGDGSSWTRLNPWKPVMAGATGSQTAPAATSQPPMTASATGTPTNQGTPQTSPTPGATVNASDSTTAPLAFTSWGVVAVGDGKATGWPYIMDFSVTSAQ